MNFKRQLRIGIDFHGVITEAPAFFRDLTTLAFDRDYEIYIISGGPYLVEKNFLDAWHIKYTEIFSLLEHFALLSRLENIRVLSRLHLPSYHI